MPGKAGERREWLGSRCISPLPAAERGADTAVGRRQVFRFLQVCSCAGMPGRTRGSVRWNGWRRLCRGAPQYAKKGREREAHNWQSTGNLPPKRRKTSRKFPKTEIFLHATRPKRTFFIIFAPEKSVWWRTMDRSSEAEKAIGRDELAKEKGEKERKGAGFKKSAKKC